MTRTPSVASTPPSYIDPDLISLHSAAPSYTSSVPPTYTPSLPPPGPVSLPRNQQYSSLIPASATPSHHQFNVASWPSLSNQTQSRTYLNVAARRARREQERREVDVRRTVVDSAIAGPSSAALAQVGESRSSEDALQAENRAWDFFHAQVQDWEQRQISWRAFKERHSGVKGKGKGKARWIGRFG